MVGNTSTQEAEARKSRVQGQPELLRDSFSKTNKKRRGGGKKKENEGEDERGSIYFIGLL
jgi:hypothetical protein